MSVQRGKHLQLVNLEDAIGLNKRDRKKNYAFHPRYAPFKIW